MKKLEHIDGDIFKVRGIQVIGHQANTQNTFGSGIARTIREKFPEAYEADCQAAKEGVNKLGNISMAEIKRRTNVVGIFPSESSCDRLVGAQLLERHESWQCETARYLVMDHIAQTPPKQPGQGKAA